MRIANATPDMRTTYKNGQYFISRSPVKIRYTRTCGIEVNSPADFKEECLCQKCRKK